MRAYVHEQTLHKDIYTMSTVLDQLISNLKRAAMNSDGSSLELSVGPLSIIIDWREDEISVVA